MAKVGFNAELFFFNAGTTENEATP